MAILSVEFHIKRLGTTARLSTQTRGTLASHAHHELMVLDRGKSDGHVQNKVLSILPGAAWWYAAGVKHQTQMHQTCDSRHWYLAWTGEPRPPTPFGTAEDRSGRLSTILSWMYDRWLTGDIDLVETIHKALLAELGRLHAGVHASDPMERLRHHVEQHAAHALSLSELAAYAGLSTRTLQRRFCDRYGCGPIAWHRRVRAETATRLLCSTTLSTAEIAQQLGFDQVPALARFLHRHNGATPQQLRSQKKSQKKFTEEIHRRNRPAAARSVKTAS